MVGEAGDSQDRTDDHGDDPQNPDDVDGCHETDDEENHSQKNHRLPPCPGRRKDRRRLVKVSPRRVEAKPANRRCVSAGAIGRGKSRVATRGGSAATRDLHTGSGRGGDRVVARATRTIGTSAGRLSDARRPELARRQLVHLHQRQAQRLEAPQQPVQVGLVGHLAAQ